MATFEILAATLARALRVLAFAMLSEEGIHVLIERIGWTLPTIPPSLKSLGEELVQLHTSLADLSDARLNADVGNGDSSEVESRLMNLASDLAVAVEQLYALPDHLRSELPADFVAATGIDAEITDRLFSWLLSIDMLQNAPLLYHLLRLASVIEVEKVSADPAHFQPAFEKYLIHWKRLLKITDPVTIAREVYGWGTPTFDTTHLFSELVPLSFALGMPAEIRYASTEFMKRTSPASNSQAEPVPQLWVPVLQMDDFTLYITVTGVVKVDEQEPQALALALIPSAEGESTVQLGDNLELSFQATARVGTGAALILRPDHPSAVILDMESATGGTLTTGRITAILAWRAAEGETPTGFSVDSGSLITASTISLGLGAEVTGKKTEIFAELAIDEVKLQIAPSPEDGLLSSILPSEGLTAQFSLTVRWSENGLHFQGSAGLTTSIPLNIILGPLWIQTTNILIRTEQGSVAGEVSLTAVIGLGPLMLTIDRVGLTAEIQTLPGNLGPVDLAVSFKSPEGAGIVVDDAIVTGGGFLSFDPKKGEYSGVLDLQIKDTIAVKAVGLLVTHMPNGAKGYSLLIIITEEGFEPIPLPLGFKLTGIGGLLALNRTFDEDALRAGLKNHMLESVMFPKDPVRNAPQILSNLNKIFPPSDGQHLFGPMARIAWGTPTLLTADLALVLEIGARLRLLILARIVAVLPKPENDLVHLEMDGVGVIDFDQGTAALDATLHDSRLLKKFVLTGDMAMRLKWDNAPNFALAVGGLHPAFNPPPAFPKLERIALNLAAGNNPRLRCEAYFALTANTVQFGARAELYAAAAGFSIQGDMGFDVLIQFAPFFFIADFYAQVQLKRGSTNLFKVKVEGALSGPRPLHIKGKASFSILWWDISIRIDKTLVGGEKPPLPEPIDVLPLLKEALADAANWKGQLPDARRPMVTLRAGPRAAAEVLLHPLGTLSVKQNIVPLDMEISRFGQAAPSGVRRFAISSVNLGGEKQSTQSVKDFFAPAQFFEMSDNEKLSRPSFEPMTAGVTIGSNEILFTADAEDWLEVGAIEFETIVVDKQKGSTQPGDQVNHHNPYRLSAELLALQARFGAAAKSDLRRTGKARYRTVVGKNKVVKEGWSVVATDNLKVAPVPGIEEEKPTNYSEAVQALHKLKQEDPAKAAGLKILRLSELS